LHSSQAGTIGCLKHLPAKLDFLSGRLTPEPPPPESPQQKKAALRYSRLQEELARDDGDARGSTIHQLQRDAERPDDSPERRVARRVLFGVFVGAMEQGALLDAKRYGKAAQAWELAVLARPKNAEAWYALAESRAGAHDKRGALDALERAIANGFDARDRIEHDPLFDGLRKEPKFAAAITALKP
jgi:tetratricopeptide (TPR) repeat protein